MISADTAFETAANAAAAAFAREPAALTYRVRVDIDRVTTHSSLESAVVLQTASGLATVRDLSTAIPAAEPSPARGGPPPGLPIALDALAEWGFRLEDSGADARLAVAYERPHRYAPSVAAAGVDVAVSSVRGYRTAYVPGEPNHVRLDPVTPEMRAYAAGEDDFVYHDLVFDPATMLPTRVVLTAPDQTLTLDYGVTDGRWLLRRALDEDASRTHDKFALRRLEATYTPEA